MSEDLNKKEEDKVEERRMEMFVLTDFQVVKDLIKYTSFPSKTYIYQMPNKATSYADDTVDAASNLMNSLLAYQRNEEWRVDQCTHSSEWSYPKEGEKEGISIKVTSTKNGKDYNLLLNDVKQAIVVPELHSVTIIPGDNVTGDIQPNMIIRFVGLVNHKYFKCILVGKDDEEHEGQRVLSMKLEAM